MKPTTTISKGPVMRCLHRFIQSIAGGIILFLAFQPVTALGQGDLLITPSRIVFDGTTSSQILNLANTGNDTARYLISFIQYRMTEQGAFEEITTPDPGQQFADKHVRYFPRNVILGPNESQVVRIQTVSSGKLSPGEYRSHLYFRSIPEQNLLGEEEQPSDSTTISVKLVPVFGITIPVILKVGESTTKTTISGLYLTKNDDKPMLTLTINRTGNMSAYGNLTVDYISPEGQITEVGMVKGVAVYSPNRRRQITLPLTFPNGMPYGEGNLRIAYSAASDLDTTTLAQTDIALNQIPLADTY